jgi:hypothetical protein
MRRLMTTDLPAAGHAAGPRSHSSRLAAGPAQPRCSGRGPRLLWRVPWAESRSGRPARWRPIRPWAALALFYLLVALPGTWTGTTPKARSTAETSLPPQCLLPGSASQQALRDSAFWWAQAVQVANDECDEERAALEAWDPAAVLDEHAELRRLLASDPNGYLRRAEQAARRAAALARAPEASDRAARQLARLGRATVQHLRLKPRSVRDETRLRGLRTGPGSEGRPGLLTQSLGGRARAQEAGGRGSSREPPVARLE